MTAAGHGLVFVAGLHRSGTTPLARVLSEHPQVSGFSGTGATEDEGQHLQQVYPPARVHGGSGKFAFSPAAHLTEQSPLAVPANAERLLQQWSPYWDLGRPVLVEKSPANLLMTRFLQALFPQARFVVVVRHPVVVALSTRKWVRRTTLPRLVEHWLAAHEILLADAPHVRALHVLSYEHLVADPAGTLEGVRDFLGLDGDIPAGSVDARRSSRYEQEWAALRTSRNPWHRRQVRRIETQLGDRVRRFGYDLDDLSAARGFPPAPASPPAARS
ncbi:MAG TPA: sulfotransferase [Mycobacteriales bacterium]|jgi:transposase|nr:sulfotransferase [Mycobacteriales bacterium]